MSVPRVLVFIDWYKPFFKAGGPVRSIVNMVEHLQGRIEAHIVTGDRDYTATKSSLEVPPDQWTVLDRGEHVWYASPRGRTLSSWKALLKEQAWDVVYINGLYSFWSTIVPLWLLRGSKQRRIVAVRGMLASGPMAQGGMKKRVYLKLMKLSGCFKGVEFQATNAGEREEIVRWIGKEITVHLVPNLGRGMNATGPVPVEKRTGELRLVSMARIALEKNTAFAIERLKGLRGEVRFDLYGTIYDETYWQRCLSLISSLPANVKVEWHGQAESERVSDIIAGAHVLFMPSVGENFGHSMLDALSVGRPLLISDRTPWKELDPQSAGWDIPLDRPDLYELALAELVEMDGKQFHQLMEGAFGIAQRSLSDTEPRERSLAMFKP